MLLLAPRAGLEPATGWLTENCSDGLGNYLALSKIISDYNIAVKTMH